MTTITAKTWRCWLSDPVLGGEYKDLRSPLSALRVAEVYASHAYDRLGAWRKGNQWPVWVAELDDSGEASVPTRYDVEFRNEVKASVLHQSDNRVAVPGGA